MLSEERENVAGFLAVKFLNVRYEGGVVVQGLEARYRVGADLERC